MKWVWTWSGRSFGYWLEKDLWSYHGKHVGRLSGIDVFAPTGRYIGELMSNGRLKTNKTKAAMTGPGFVPSHVRGKEIIVSNLDGRAPYMGFEDFPNPDEF